MSKKEIETMFMGDLPDLEETRSGKDLIEIGEKRGEARGEARGEVRGLAAAIVMFLETQQGPLPEAIRQGLRALQLPQLQELLPQVYRGLTLDQLEAWLTAQGSPSGVSKHRA